MMEFLAGMLFGVAIGIIGSFGTLCACAFWISKDNDEKRDAK